MEKVGFHRVSIVRHPRSPVWLNSSPFFLDVFYHPHLQDRKYFLRNTSCVILKFKWQIKYELRIFTPQLWTLTPQSSSCIQSELKVTAQNLPFSCTVSGQSAAQLSACHFLHCSSDDEYRPHQMSNRSRFHDLKQTDVWLGLWALWLRSFESVFRFSTLSVHQDAFSAVEELRPKSESVKVTFSVLVLPSDSPHYRIPPVRTQITFTELSRNHRTLLHFAVWLFLWTEQGQTEPNRGWTRTDQRGITSLLAEREREDNSSDISRPHKYQSVWMLLPDLTLHCLLLLLLLH